MKLSEKLIEQLQADVANSSSINELLGKERGIKKLLKRLLEEVLSAELSGHLGYNKHDKVSTSTANRRNGKSAKTLRSNYGNHPGYSSRPWGRV